MRAGHVVIRLHPVFDHHTRGSTHLEDDLVIGHRAGTPALRRQVLDRPLAHEALNERPRRLEPLARLRRQAFAKFESFAADAEREAWRRRLAKRA